ncbi:hypothetical protein [Thermomonospora curvata]|uniref:Mce-associated membrane protein n=1 Tax=Thermomonospora curvata (strain ATCC 19995 / DSM 43183 / JCM 3096 / KCTC 9072 / NBRC 15933 / NCIMB 10081 / Henssen B9) TaxID=471852 RepID=D1A396_THECD|nr:hypothetical protein [Thermomonospora curvata]ACY99866.1 conserved hypothetical protein [Thermomonospora curvata DSM 43183]
MTMLGRGGRATSEAGKPKKGSRAEKKARKAEEAARRAEELAEQARKAAEEARAALREAEEAAEAEAAEAEAEEAAEAAGGDEAAEAEEKTADAGTAEDQAEDQAEEDGAAATKVLLDKETDEEDDEDVQATVADRTKVDETVEEAVDETVEEAAEEPAAAKRRVVVRAGLGASGVVLLVLAVALGGALGFLVYKKGQLEAAEEARKEVAFAAAQAAQDLSSYDYRTVDSDLRRATGHTTGKFREEFAKQAEQVGETARKQQTVTEGVAIKTGVERVSGSTAVALVFLNQQTAKADTAERLPNQYTLRLTMRKVGDRWLVEKLQVM